MANQDLLPNRVMDSIWSRILANLALDFSPGAEDPETARNLLIALFLRDLRGQGIPSRFLATGQRPADLLYKRLYSVSNALYMTLAEEMDDEDLHFTVSIAVEDPTTVGIDYFYHLPDGAPVSGFILYSTEQDATRFWFSSEDTFKAHLQLEYQHLVCAYRSMRRWLEASGLDAHPCRHPLPPA